MVALPILKLQDISVHNKDMKKILFIFTILLILGIIYLFFSLLPAARIDKSGLELTTPTATPSVSTAEISIVSIVPANNTTTQYNPVQQILVTFNKPVNPAAVLINTSPTTKTLIRQGENLSTIIISADPAWTEGITKILIYVSGNTKPFTYELNSGYPPVPTEDIYY